MAVVVDSMRELFNSLIWCTTEGLPLTDRIQFCIQTKGLDKPISTKKIFVFTLTIEKVMSAVRKVLQSKDHIKFHVGFSVDAISVINPIGVGHQKITNISLDHLEKQCILNIPPNEGGLCCANVHLENDRKAINTKKRYVQHLWTVHESYIQMAESLKIIAVSVKFLNLKRTSTYR